MRRATALPLRPHLRQVNNQIGPQSDQSSHCTLWVAKNSKRHQADQADVFDERTCSLVGDALALLIFTYVASIRYKGHFIRIAHRLITDVSNVHFSFRQFNFG